MYFWEEEEAHLPPRLFLCLCEGISLSLKRGPGSLSRKKENGRNSDSSMAGWSETVEGCTERTGTIQGLASCKETVLGEQNSGMQAKTQVYSRQSQILSEQTLWRQT